MTEAERIGGIPGAAPDEAFVRATLRGDDAAFAELVRRYLRKAMAVALEFVCTRADAEDVVQETFRRVLQNLDRFDAARSFEPWFFTILRNTGRNASRAARLRRHETLTQSYASPASSPFDDAHRGELRARILAAIERLPPMQRTCFRLCVIEGLTSGEAAVAIGLAESTVRVHVYKGRQTLRGLLAEWREEVEA